MNSGEHQLLDFGGQSSRMDRRRGVLIHYREPEHPLQRALRVRPD